MVNDVRAERPGGAVNRASRGIAWVLVLLVLVGVALRLHDLGERSLWADELFTVGVALYHPLLPDPGQPWYRPTSVLGVVDGDTFLSVKAGEQSPPLFDLLVKASTHALGPTEVAARLPAALAACALLLWVAWHAWRERGTVLGRILLGALALLAVHPGLVAYAHEARAYSLGTSLVGMGLVLWLRRWQGGVAWIPPSWGEVALFLGASYSHYNAAALVCLLLAPDAVMAWRRRSRPAALRLGTLALLFFVWVAINVQTIVFTAKGGVAWSHVAAPGVAQRDMLNMLHPAWVATTFVLALGLGIGAALRRPRPGWHAAALPMALAALLLAYGVLATLIAQRAGMQHPRYYIFATPLALFAMAALWATVTPRWLAWCLGAIWLALSQVPRLPGTPLQGEEDFRGAVQAAARGADAGTLFLYPWRPNQNLYRVYLDRELGQDSRPLLVSVSGAAEIAAVCLKLSQASRVAVMAHASQTAIIDQVYAACGKRWPHRERMNFSHVIAERWH